MDGPLLARIFLRAAWSLAVICLACECGRTWTAGPDRFRGLRPYQFVGISLPGSSSLETPRVFLDPSVDGLCQHFYCPRELAVPPRLGRLRLPPRIGGRPVWSSSAQARFAASGVLPRQESEPWGELPATVERAGLRDSRRNGGDGDWPDAGDGRQALATVESSRPHKPAVVLAGGKTTPPSAVAFGQS